jgi:hypothetical protein
MKVLKFLLVISFLSILVPGDKLNLPYIVLLILANCFQGGNLFYSIYSISQSVVLCWLIVSTFKKSANYQYEQWLYISTIIFLLPISILAIAYALKNNLSESNLSLASSGVYLLIFGVYSNKILKAKRLAEASNLT